MTPKEKAIEVYFKMLKWQDDSSKYIERSIISTTAKQCALIAVDEIINEFYTHPIAKIYWQEVKKEIEQL
jgi:hypothetical protein